MNVLKVQMAVLRHVAIPMGVTPALVALDIVWQVTVISVMVSVQIIQ